MSEEQEQDLPETPELIQAACGAHTIHPEAADMHKPPCFCGGGHAPCQHVDR